MTAAALLENLLRTIAPHDLQGAPVYILLASDEPGESRLQPEAAYGLYARNLSLALFDHLESRGQWQGAGVALILNDVAMRADAAKLAPEEPEIWDDLTAARVLAVGLHEGAHALELGYLQCPESDLGRVADSLSQQLVAYCTTPAPKFALPWRGHEASYIRTLCHVLERVARLGVRVVENIAFEHASYALSPLWRYQTALAGELKMYRGTFAELQAHPMPRAFTDLWQADQNEFALMAAELAQLRAENQHQQPEEV